jgi:predicted nucleic acid-binding protein
LALLDFIRDNRFNTYVSDEGSYETALKLFRKEFKRLSFCDFATIAAMNELNISALASYDTRSFFSLVSADIYGKKYFESLSDKDAVAIKKNLSKYHKSSLK